MNRIVSVAFAGLFAVVFVDGCQDSGSIVPDLRASITSSIDPERGPAPRAPEATSRASAKPATAAAPVAAVVTMGPGAACVTYPDGITTCTTASSSSTRFGGLF